MIVRSTIFDHVLLRSLFPDYLDLVRVTTSSFIIEILLGLLLVTFEVHYPVCSLEDG